MAAILNMVGHRKYIQTIKPCLLYTLFGCEFCIRVYGVGMKVCFVDVQTIDLWKNNLRTALSILNECYGLRNLLLCCGIGKA